MNFQQFLLCIYIFLPKYNTLAANDIRNIPHTTEGPSSTTTTYPTATIISPRKVTILTTPRTSIEIVKACEGNCVRKCCGDGLVFVKNRSRCIEPPPGVDLWYPDNVKNPQLIYGNPKGKEDEHCLEAYPNEYYLRSDGKVQNDSNTYDYNSYCIDRLLIENSSTIFAAICKKQAAKETFDLIADNIHLAGSIISCISLLILLTLEIFVIRQTKDFQSKCLVSMTIAMFFAFVTLSINASPLVTSIRAPDCITLAICQQFFFLSFYFWLNVKCFEIWRIIRGSVMGTRMIFLEGTFNRYLVYSIYAWGIPLTVSIITIILQVMPPDQNSNILRPRIAEGRCWFAESMDILFAYYYGLQTVLHVSNVALIVHAGYMMYFKRTRVDVGDSQVHNKNCLKKFWQQFYILATIVVIWTLDSVTLIYSKQRFWRLIDVLNTLQGLFLLILVIARDKDVRNKIKSASSSTMNSISTTISSSSPSKARGSSVDLSAVELSAVSTETADSYGAIKSSKN